MPEGLSALWLIVSTVWRTDRRRALGAFLEAAGKATGPLQGLWLALLVNGVVRDDALLSGAGVGGMAVGQSLNLVAQLYGTEMRLALSEAVGHAFDHQIATLAASLPGLDHHECPEYQDRLELLRDTQNVLGQSLNTLVYTADTLLVAAVTLVLLASADPLLLALALLALPSIWVARRQQGWYKAAEEAAAPHARLCRHLRELMEGHASGAELRVSRLEEEVLARYERSWGSRWRPMLQARRRASLTSATEQFVAALGFVAAVGFTMWRAAEGHTTAGEILLVAVVAPQVQNQVLQPIYSVAGLGATLRAAQRLLWLKDYARRQAPQGREAVPGRLNDGITIEHVSFHYPGSGQPVLRDVSAHLPAGSVVAIVGENGAGKTTLVKLLIGLYQPSAGRVLVDGKDLASLDPQAWRQHLAAAFQDFARLELLARHSVGVGDLPRADHDPAILAGIERAGATGVLGALPQRLDTQLGASWDGGVELSVGQWQKLALGRALMREQPLVIFLDEPTASLDAFTEHSLFERYSKAARSGRGRGAITILVSHRFSTVRMADLILVLEGGRLTESGSHLELVRLGGRYAELYELQARAYR